MTYYEELDEALRYFAAAASAAEHSMACGNARLLLQRKAPEDMTPEERKLAMELCYEVGDYALIKDLRKLEMIDAYWIRHPYSKAGLLEEKKALETEVAELERKLTNAAEEKELSDMQSQIQDYKNKKESIGFLKKRRLETEIHQLEKEYNSLLKKRKEDIQEQISSRKSRIRAIDYELTRERTQEEMDEPPESSPAGDAGLPGCN